MQITPQNYYEVWERTDKSALPGALVEAHQVIVDTVNAFGWRYFDEDESSKGVFEAQVNALAPYVKEQAGQGVDADDKSAAKASPKKPKPAAEKEAKGSKKKGPAKAATKDKPAKAGRKKKADKPASADVRLVRDLDVELQLMRRFTGLHGKAKTRKQVLALLAALNRAITKGHIRKSFNPTRFHPEMAYIQGRLAYALAHAFKKAKEGDAVLLDFNEEEVSRIKGLVKSYAVFPSVRLALRFFAMEGKAPELSKARALLEQVRKAVTSGQVRADDPPFQLINRVEAALADYVEGGSSTVQVPELALEGLAGVVLGCPCKRRANAR